MKRFVEKYSDEERSKTSSSMLQKYPTMVPVICEPSHNCKLDLTSYKKSKYLVPKDTTVGRFLLEIRKQLVLRPEEAVFLFINNTLPPISATMYSVYEKYKSNDGFVYIVFVGEDTFGSFSQVC